MHPRFFFGYGSLVNRGTHDFENVHLARLSGWKRAWRRTPIRQVSYLTVVPDADAMIEGLIAEVPAHGWAGLDERERAYARHHATPHVAHGGPDGDIVVYAIPAEHLTLPDQDHPIYLSYVDAVLQGYLREYGVAGAERFVATTDGWDITPIVNDRGAPRYPRAQVLTEEERTLVDETLRRAGSRVVSPA